MPVQVRIDTVPDGADLPLLQEWLTWWYFDADTPAKMPNALHVRSAALLAAAGMEVPHD